MGRKSRRSLRIGLGGYLLAGAVLLGGLTTGVVIGTDDDDPPDPRTIGRDPGEFGVREATTGFLEAIAARDPERVCAFIVADEVSNMRLGGGCAAVLQDVVPMDVTGHMADLEIVSDDRVEPLRSGKATRSPDRTRELSFRRSSLGVNL